MRALATLAAVLLCMASGAARADTPITLFKSIAGNVNFVGTQQTMRIKGNGAKICDVTSPSTVISASLSGIPSTATIQSAQLYWAGSGGTVADTITFEGASVTAVAGRRYFSNTIGSGYNYFGGAADVTAQVLAKRNGTYSFSGLTVDNGSPYCAADGVLGGFALLVVYSNPAEPFRVLNIYEGFQFIRNGSLALTSSNFRMPNPLDSSSGKFGHIIWEGDGSVGLDGEDLFFNGYEQFDFLNPKQNQFNSASNINNDKASYGIDFDAYTIPPAQLTAGQTTIATRFQSGQDLVLLNAQIIAVPNVPTADLYIVTTRNSVLTQNQLATYTFSVSNGGPSVETGPVVVTITLPSGLSYQSASGGGWSCGAAGQVVTCSNSSALAVGAALPLLSLTTRVAGTGTLTVAASVTGQLFDNNTTNNSSSDTSTVVTLAAAYSFTDSACVSGFPFGAAQQTCKALSGQPVVAGEAAPVFVTALSAGVPTAVSTSADTTVKMMFAISCINPASDAGIKAKYVSKDLQLCTANGAAPGTGSISWSSMTDMVFKQGAASVVANAAFSYADVGKIQLYLRDTNGTSASSVPFVVKPASLEILSITRNADGLVNPAAISGADNGFAKVGEAFTVKAVARTANPTRDAAPNFGREGARLVPDWKPGGDVAVRAAMGKLPTIAGDFTSVTAGVFTGSAFASDEVGIMALTPRLDNNDYLATGAPPSVTVNVGRFFPDHFDTNTAVPMQCLPHMTCPSTVTGAAYSGQSFTVTVKPMGPAGTLLSNFNGVLARDIALAAYTNAGATTQYPATYVLSNATIPAAAVAPGLATGNPVFALPQPFSGAAPRARNWTAPSAIYLRATANENTVSGNATISSLRSGATASIEGGVTILSGRLALDNPHGSELMKMPVRAQAQYWTTGGRWEASATDNASSLLTGGIAFANCRSALGPPCKNVLGVTSIAQQTLKDGVTTFWLKAPGAGNHGSAEFQMNNPAWLPTTIGRAVFGVYKSPLIYMREVY